MIVNLNKIENPIPSGKLYLGVFFIKSLTAKIEKVKVLFSVATYIHTLIIPCSALLNHNLWLIGKPVSDI